MGRVLRVLAVAALAVVSVGGGASGRSQRDPVLCRLASTPAELGSIVDIATGPDGTVYLVDQEVDEINAFVGDVHVRSIFAPLAAEVEVEPAGTLLALDSDANRMAVVRIEADGSSTDLVVNTNADNEFPAAIASLPDGSFAVGVAVAGIVTRVDFYDAAANLQSQTALPAPRFPDMVADSAGRVYLSGLASILRIDTSGAVDLELLGRAGDLAVDSADRLYADRGVGDEIAVYEPDGTPLPPIATGIDAGVNGHEVAVDSAGRIILFSEQGQLYQLDGPSDTTIEPLALARRLVASRYSAIASNLDAVVALQSSSDPAVEIVLPGGFRGQRFNPDSFGVSTFVDVGRGWLALGSRPGERSVVVDLLGGEVLHAVPAGTTLMAGAGFVAGSAERATIVVTRRGDVVAMAPDGSAVGAPIPTGMEDPIAASVDEHTNTVFVMGPAGAISRIELFARTVEPFPAPGAYPGAPDPVDLVADAGVVWVADHAGGVVYGFDATAGSLGWSLVSDDPIWPLTAPYAVTSFVGTVGVLDDPTNAYLQFDCGQVTPLPTGIGPQFTG